MMLLLIPTTPRTCWTIRSTSSRWYCHSTSPLSVTQPARTCACTLPSGIWVLLSGHLRVPPQLLDDFFPDLAVGFHRLPPGRRAYRLATIGRGGRPPHHTLG